VIPQSSPKVAPQASPKVMPQASQKPMPHASPKAVPKLQLKPVDLKVNTNSLTAMVEKLKRQQILNKNLAN
jgi:hypothetical protein